MKTATGVGLLASLCLWCASARSAPITFNTALPVYEGGWVLREQFLYMKVADDPTSMDRDMRVTGGVTVLGYGVTRDFALFAMLPYSDKRLDMNFDGQPITRRERGLGDATVMGRYTAYERNRAGQTLRIAPFLGVKTPTGRDDAHDRYGRLPPPLQPGSASWDLLSGVVATYQTLDFQIDGQLSYKANGGANGFRAGDIAEADISLQYRLWPRSLGSGVPGFLYGVMEANWVHTDQDRVSGVTDPDSGGTTLYLSPGVQYVTKRWVIEAGARIPVNQHRHGAALKDDFAVTAGFRVNF